MNDSGDNVVDIETGGSGFGFKTIAGYEIPEPPPGARLERQARRIYDYLCVVLARDGRKVGTAGVHLLMLTHTLHAWSEDMKLCLEGRYGTTSNGNKVELPHSYNERKAREQIMKDLPEACLTVMSTIEARLKESKIGEGDQDDLFADLAGHVGSRPSARSA